MITANEAKAVSVKEFKEFGCPFCGSPRGYARINNGAASLWECGGCGRLYVILAKDVTVSPLFVNVGGARVRPSLEPHPLRPPNPIP